ncbi:MAG: formate dehydrogenase subunit gamma [Betaproteobacteria bacterium RIFCSPLOWO2_02_FULL_62_17]|nr:MAG: formate dehydrogenase subunit gamma [Betaproteobacteria bacterium RIFCSPLOWO2_02_FULL_62_17]
MSESNMVQRYTPNERGNHWIVAVCFVLAACSGLALFHPSFYFLSAVLGGGPWSRILHPFVGVLMFAFFFVIMARFWNLNRINDADRKWMQRVRDVIMNRDEGLPEVGKYNAAQKYLFWTIVVCLWLMLATGLVMWRPYLAEQFPIWLIRISVLVHALAAFVLITGIIVHIYSAIWVKGSLQAMVRGTVTANWAKAHHRAWYREVTGK